MEKLALAALEKLQKREHLLRVAREFMGTGRITREVFREREAEIVQKYRLTDAEQAAYERHLQMTRQRRR